MMERYMLDTNAVVEMLRGNRNVVGQIEKHGIQNCFISEITIAELTYGAIKSGNSKHFNDIEIVESLFQIVPIYPSFLDYARIRHHLTSTGFGIDTFDMLIGASAVQGKYVLITHNNKHFSRIPNLQIEDWQYPLNI